MKKKEKEPKKAVGKQPKAQKKERKQRDPKEYQILKVKMKIFRML